MGTDVRHLLAALEEYHAALSRQVATLHAELDPLRNSWAALSAVYEGNAAEQFRAGWLRAEHMLQDYLSTASALQPRLSERIEALRQADRPGDEPL
jgi:uncharacterized protein YukE